MGHDRFRFRFPPRYGMTRDRGPRGWSEGQLVAAGILAVVAFVLLVIWALVMWR